MKIHKSLQFQKFKLTRDWALVTGAAGLLGIEHCRALLEAGANVVMVDINAERLSEAQGMVTKDYPDSSILISNTDITSENSVKVLLQNLIEKGILVKILVNNAAINPKYNDLTSNRSRVEYFELDDWNKQISVGLTGAFICSKIFGTEMAKNRSGVIVNIASDLSVIGPDQRIYKRSERSEMDQPVKPVTYSVIKAGIIGLTKYLATYWNESGVRVNSLSPGGVFQDQDRDFVSQLSALIPLGRMANSDEYRSAIQFLSSDASSYMTGQNLIIDGGRTTW
jgi:NAD(P)-dependent dehydrogenase (short-subunit alcohol dehydrogenase family)